MHVLGISDCLAFNIVIFFTLWEMTHMTSHVIYFILISMVSHEIQGDMS